jgi:hypothetical protein
MLNLTVLGLYAVASGIMGNSMPPMNTTVNNPAETFIEVRREDISQESIEGFVRSYFSDTPVLAEIARCESQFRQTDKSGRVIRGKSNRYDVGIMQINELYHLDRAEILGYDIYSKEGNLAFARYLYEKEGARPWMASSPCWARFKDKDIAYRVGNGLDHVL